MIWYQKSEIKYQKLGPLITTVVSLQDRFGRMDLPSRKADWSAFAGTSTELKYGFAVKKQLLQKDVEFWDKNGAIENKSVGIEPFSVIFAKFGLK